MGCVKKMLGVAEFKDHPSSRLEIELNEGASAGRESVHLQTTSWRIEQTEPEFKAFAAAICEAGKKLRQLKRSTDREPASHD